MYVIYYLKDNVMQHTFCVELTEVINLCRSLTEKGCTVIAVKNPEGKNIPVPT